MHSAGWGGPCLVPLSVSNAHECVQALLLCVVSDCLYFMVFIAFGYIECHVHVLDDVIKLS